MSQERIALLTYKDEPGLADAEKLLPPAFAKAGIEAVATPWDGDVNWDSFSTIILRACWNYHLKRDEFITWLDNQAKSGRNIWNPIDVIKWNTDKHYLLDLEKKNINIIPTSIIEPNDDTNLVDILNNKNWIEAVIKPTIGASAYGVRKFNYDTAAEINNTINRTNTWIVQKFCPQINSEGEYSLIFFDKKYSHSVMKKPKDGDFRTQPHYGGSEWKVVPDEKIISQAKEVLDKVDGQLLYARVDGVVVEGEFNLMELELAEPYLFLDFDHEAPQKFVNAYKWLCK